MLAPDPLNPLSPTQAQFDKTPALEILEFGPPSSIFHALHVQGPIDTVVPPPFLRRLTLSLPAWTLMADSPLLQHPLEDLCLTLEAVDVLDTDTVFLDTLDQACCASITVAAIGVAVILPDMSQWTYPISAHFRADFSGSIVLHRPPPCMTIDFPRVHFGGGV